MPAGNLAEPARGAAPARSTPDIDAQVPSRSGAVGRMLRWWQDVAYEGTILVGRFEIERLAGRGGMGHVYRAIDRATGGAAAVKIVQDELSESRRARFVREAQLLAELEHPAIVRYLSHGHTERNEPFLAMEWLEGEELGTRLVREGVTARAALPLLRRVAEAIGVAHARGIVHRDLKPSNLMLVGGELARVKVLDFGVARVQAEAMTRTGAAIGTPGYMAPEQARGSRDVDARADVFSLGCLLYECLTGRPPFSGESIMATLAKILLEDAPRLADARPDLPRALDELVARMLAKDPAARPRDGAAVAQELASFADLVADSAPPARARDSAVTIGEQRLACIVLARGVVGARTGEVAAMVDDDDTLTIVNTPRGTGSGGPDAALPALSAAVAGHGGLADVLADGSVVVTVLGEGAATDQAARAARCALAVRDIAPLAPMALAMGRGVVRGRAPLGRLIDRAAALLAAPPVNPMAATSIMQAVPGCQRVPDRLPIRVDEVAAGLLDVRFAIAGDDQGLALVGERDVGGAARTLLGRPTPCVGRERELAMLGAVFDECVAEPRSHVVVVTAPAGVGKSRLRHELVRRIRERSGEIWIAAGDPLAAGAPFALLGQALRRTAGVLDGEPATVRHLKLRARVSRHVPGHDVPRVAEFLGELIGAPSPEPASVQLAAARGDPQLMGDQMLRACEDLVAAETAAAPLVLVLEDLHWGDLPTVRFVDALLRRLPDRPLLVLALARPEVDTVFPRLWAERDCERIQLGELTRRAGEKLVRETLGARVDDAGVARLVDRAAGNAFYHEELIRTVAEGRGDELPGSVLAMAQARIEGLEVEARHVLRAASIFGQVFWRGGVAELVEGGPTHVSDWLEELVRRELVVVARDSRFPGEIECVFRHALVREAAYAMLTDRDRARGHLRAGEWLEARVRAARPDERAGQAEAVALAEHFERAGQPRRSVAWYRQAAEQALEGDDLAGAIERADRAIACVRADKKSTQDDRALIGVLRQVQADAHAWRAEYSLAEEHGFEALELLAPESAAWLAAAAAVADARVRRFEHGKVLAICHALAGVAPAPVTHRPLAHAIATTMPTLLWHGDAALIARLFAQLDRIEAEAGGGDPAALAWVLHARSWRAMQAGDGAACLVLDSRVVELFTQLGDLRHACQQRANVGYDELMLGAYAQAELSLVTAIEIATRIGLAQVTAQARHNLGLAVLRQGRIDEARAIEQAALDALLAHGNQRLAAAAHHYLALVELAAGDLAAAAHRVDASLAMGADSPAMQIGWLPTRSLVRRLAGDPAGALHDAEAALALAAQHGRPEEGDAAMRLAYAEALHATGALDAARAAIADAEARLLDAAARIGDPAWRRSYLEAIPEHARTRHLAAAWRGG